MDKPDVVSLVITGDGRTEYRRLGYIADKFDDDDILFFPSRPERRLSIRGRQREPSHQQQRGLSALEALRVFKGMGYNCFVFLADLEHISGESPEAIEADLATKLREISTSDDIELEVLGEGSFRCSLELGAQELTVLTAIIGDEFECFEDGLASLLESEWGNTISVDSRDELKSEIGSILSGGQERSLLESADRYSIEECFPDLSNVLAEFECE